MHEISIKVIFEKSNFTTVIFVIIFLTLNGHTYKSFKKILKGKDYCPIEIIKGLTDKGQFQYLTNLKGPQVGNYLYTTQFLTLR